MADIAKCNGEGCPLKDSCRRYTAPSGHPYIQSWIHPPIKDGKCEQYWFAWEWEQDE